MKKLMLFMVMTIVSMNVLANGMMAHDAYVRLLPPTAKITAAFMTLMNHGDKTMKLIKVESDIANKVELHNHIKINGMMKMREVESITIKKNKSIELKPGSYHIMLIGIKKALKKGQEVKLKLYFDDKSSIEVKAPVKDIHTTSKMKHHH